MMDGQLKQIICDQRKVRKQVTRQVITTTRNRNSFHEFMLILNELMKEKSRTDV